MNKELEYRSFSGLSSEEREEGKPLTISGYFSVFNSESRDLGGFTEVIEPGAFDSSLRSGNDIKALAFHDYNKVLGRMKNGSMELRSDSKGLYADITLPDTQFARDLHRQIQDGYIDQASFGFRIKKRELERREDGTVLQKIQDVDLREVSIVSMPAYEATEVSARCVEDFKKEFEDEVKRSEQAKHEVEVARIKLILDEE